MKLNFWEMLGIAIVIMLLITYWYIALGVAVVGGVGYGVYLHQTKPQRAAKKEQEQREYDSTLNDIKYGQLTPTGDNNPGFILKANEDVYFSSDYQVSWQEERTRTARVNYSGVTGRVKIMKGVYWRTGSIKPMPEKQTAFEIIHTGRIVLTNKRFVLLEDSGNTSQIMYSGINNIVPYTDALMIIKNRGKNVALTGAFYPEMIAVLLLRLVNKDYEAQDSASATNGATVYDFFKTLQQNDGMNYRLDEDQHFLDVSVFDIDYDSLISAHREHPAEADKELASMKENLSDASQSLSQVVDGEKYLLRVFAGANFDELLYSFRNGQVEYAFVS